MREEVTRCWWQESGGNSTRNGSKNERFVSGNPNRYWGVISTGILFTQIRFGTLGERSSEHREGRRKQGPLISTKGRRSELTDLEICAGPRSFNYLYDRNRRICTIGSKGEDGEKRRRQELLEFQRGDLEARGLNSWETKRKQDVIIVEAKRRIEE